MTLYKNKYRVESTRLKSWDYSSNGAYYLTICVNDRRCIFGNINKGKLNLSSLGQIAEQCWQEIPNHFPFVQLDEFVIMPNHVHGIIIIKKTDETGPTSSVLPGLSAMPVASMTPVSPVETQNFASQRSIPISQSVSKSQPSTKFGPQSKNIASIIRGFKIGVTKFAINNKITFKWQPRFYDHIIRDENDLNRIRQYIMDNPWNWNEDEFHRRENNE